MTINPCYKGNEGYTLIGGGGGAILISIIHMYNAGFGWTQLLMLQKFEAGLWNLMKYWYMTNSKLNWVFERKSFSSNVHVLFKMKMNNAHFYIWFQSFFFYLSCNRLNRFGNSLVCDCLGLWHYLIWMFWYLEWKFK